MSMIKTLSRIIRALLFTLVLFMILRTMAIKFGYFGDLAICEQSLSTAHVNWVSDFECKPHYETLKKEDFDEDNLEHEVKRKLADKFIDCWGMVTNSNGEYYIPYKPDPSLKYCLICDIVDFEDIPSFRGLYKWMSIYNVEGKQSYWEKYSQKTLTEDEAKEFEKVQDEYDTSKTYAIFWQKGFDVIQASTISIPIELRGEIRITPYDELIPTHCEVVMN